MADYAEIKNWLAQNNTTHEEMDAMWNYLYGKNFIVTNLTDHGKSWHDLNTHAMKTLKPQYEKEKRKEGGKSDV